MPLLTRLGLLVSLLLMVLSAPAVAANWPDLMAPIPEAARALGRPGERDAALVMGIEDYAYGSDIPGAAHNAKAWYAFFTRTHGISPSRARLLLDGEVSKVDVLDAARELAAEVKEGGTLWVVFIGHGAPAEDGSDGVLVGADARQTPKNLYAHSIRQRELLAQLSQGKQAQTVLAVDACFSGRTPSGDAVAEGLQPLIPPKVKDQYARLAKTLVLSAGRSDQFAGPLAGERRPAFSYLLLGALRGWGDTDGDGRVTAQEAVEYTRDVIRATVKGRTQTPELAVGEGAQVLSLNREAAPDLVALVLHEGKRPEPAPEVSGGGPVVKRSKISQVVADLMVQASPRDGTRLELTDPTGKAIASGVPYHNAEAVPGLWRVWARAPGHEEVRKEFLVPPDEAMVQRLELQKLGRLQVEGRPAGAAVKVTGPGGFSDEGGLPWQAEGLRSGTYRVEVSRPGYASQSQEAKVAPGTSAVVRLELVKQEGPVAASGRCPEGMVLVPGGTLTGFKQAQPSVVVGDVCWDRTKVSVAAFAACVAGKRCTPAASKGSKDERFRGSPDKYCNHNRTDRQDHPVNCVTWKQAGDFCHAQGKRLASEPEWLWAATGGLLKRKFPWGNDEPSQRACWSGVTARDSTCPMGSHPAGASAHGISDLVGNVYAWLGDLYYTRAGVRVQAGGDRLETDSILLQAYAWGHNPEKN